MTQEKAAHGAAFLSGRLLPSAKALNMKKSLGGKHPNQKKVEILELVLDKRLIIV